MTVLDDVSARRTCDPLGMLGIALSLPAQLRQMWRHGMAAPLPPPPAPPRHLVMVGMGGSGIAADLLAAALAPRLPLPLVSVRDGRLPPYVGPGSAVIATSYSGNTAETLEAASAALRAGAHLAAITSGGALADLAAGHGSVVRVPGGLAPRAALGFLLGPALAILERWELADPCEAEVEEAAATLEAMAADLGPDTPASRNPAKQLAAALPGRIPAVYAAAPELGAAARRWKCQFNENSKTLAMWDAFPELTHNETVGWGAPPEVVSRVAPIVLLEGGESGPALRRIAATREVALSRAASLHEVRARGTAPLGRLLSLVLTGDVVSVYLAYLRGVDPTPIAAIDEVKRRMREAR